MNNMMINDHERTSSSLPPGSHCRHHTFSDNKLTKNVRRRRLEVRRLKSLCESESDFAGDSWFCKKKRIYDLTKFAAQSVIALSCGGAPVSSSSENDLKMTGRSESTPSSSHGSISVIGRRRAMEDAVAIKLGFVEVNAKKYDFYGVYDGHGGSQVAKACCERLQGVLRNEVVEDVGVLGTKKDVDWEKVMVESFRKMDDKVMESEAIGSIGSTAVVAVVGEEVLVVANCGDSRAIMSRNGAPVAMSIDHKPDRPDELKRIEDLGGRVIDWNGQRVLGVLATSRSIGDKHLKPYVTSEPEVMVCKRSNEDEFLILASDGLWDVIQNDIACEVVRRCLTGRMRRRSSAVHTQAPKVVMSSSSSNGSTHDQQGCPRPSLSLDLQPLKDIRAAEAASVLAELAIARGSKDNVSVVVVDLTNN